jgi:hypothetical protein
MGRWHDYAWCWADPHQHIEEKTTKYAKQANKGLGTFKEHG